MKQIELVGGANDGKVITVADDCRSIDIPIALPAALEAIANPLASIDIPTYTVLTYAPRTQADELLGRWRVS